MEIFENIVSRAYRILGVIDVDAIRIIRTNYLIKFNSANLNVIDVKFELAESNSWIHIKLTNDILDKTDNEFDDYIKSLFALKAATKEYEVIVNDLKRY